MQAYLVVLGSLSLVFALLVVELASVRRLHRTIPIRIAVLGTRGKSSVARLIAYGLRGSGRRVVYKTTGSRSILGNADGTEGRIKRRAHPTPLEQRGVLRAAARQDVDVAVIEAMSIRPESLRAEVRRILSPSIVVVTSVGRDHVIDIEDPSAAFADAIPDAAVAIMTTSVHSQLRERLTCRSVSVREVEITAMGTDSSFAGHEEWQENVQLALAACDAAGVSADIARKGMSGVIADFGALAAWRIRTGRGVWIAVNAFAANDPQATRRVLQRSIERWRITERTPLVGLLNLRRDRGDRTVQWANALTHEIWPFDRIVVTGSAPSSIQRLLRRTFGSRVVFTPDRYPDHVMETVTAHASDGGSLFGFGNIGGIGEALVNDWMKRGEAL